MTLAAPSYLIPGTWLENARALEGESWIEGLELLFFSYDDDARRILSREREGLAALSSRYRYSVHLPDPLDAADEGLIEHTRSFCSLYVAHPPRHGAAPDSWAALVSSWTRRYGATIAVEHVEGRDFDAACRSLPDAPVCADSGSIAREGVDPHAWCLAREDRIAELHIHGSMGAKDHLPLSGSEPWLSPLAALSERRSWRVVLETFSLESARASAAAFAAALEPGRGNLP